MNNKTENNGSVLLLYTEFFPSNGQKSGPWGERFNGLYQIIFNKCKMFYKNVLWYSYSEQCFYTGAPNNCKRYPSSLYLFFIKLFFAAFCKKKRFALLIVYPVFRLREFHKRIFLMMILKALKKTKRTDIIIDFLEPPLMIISLNKINPILKKIMLLISACQEKSYLGSASRIITGGELMSQHLSSSYKIDINKFDVIEQGINISDYNQKKPRVLRHEFTVFYGGLLSEDRGALELIECIKRINELYPINLLCCGPIDTSLRLASYKWLKVYNALNYDEYIAKLLNCADVAILPYPVNDWWGKISISKLATYAAAGLPIITTALPHTAAFIHRWNCGMSAVDWNGIEEHILKLYKDRDLCQRLGQNARLAAEKTLDWKILAAKLENVLRQLETNKVGKSL